MAFAVMDTKTATKYGFPERPRIGQAFDYAGARWVWYPPESDPGLSGDGLGFWGALFATVANAFVPGSGDLIKPLFDKKGKPVAITAAEAQAAVDKARLEEQLKAAQAPRGAEAIFNKKTLPYWTLLILGFVALR